MPNRWSHILTLPLLALGIVLSWSIVLIITGAIYLALVTIWGAIL